MRRRIAHMGDEQIAQRISEQHYDGVSPANL